MCENILATFLTHTHQNDQPFMTRKKLGVYTVFVSHVFFSHTHTNTPTRFFDVVVYRLLYIYCIFTLLLKKTRRACITTTTTTTVLRLLCCLKQKNRVSQNEFIPFYIYIYINLSFFLLMRKSN